MNYQKKPSKMFLTALCPAILFVIANVNIPLVITANSNDESDDNIWIIDLFNDDNIDQSGTRLLVTDHFSTDQHLTNFLAAFARQTLLVLSFFLFVFHL